MSARDPDQRSSAGRRGPDGGLSAGRDSSRRRRRPGPVIAVIAAVLSLPCLGAVTGPPAAVFGVVALVAARRRGDAAGARLAGAAVGVAAVSTVLWFTAAGAWFTWRDLQRRAAATAPMPPAPAARAPAPPPRPPASPTDACVGLRGPDGAELGGVVVAWSGGIAWVAAPVGADARPAQVLVRFADGAVGEGTLEALGPDPDPVGLWRVPVAGRSRAVVLPALGPVPPPGTDLSAAVRDGRGWRAAPMRTAADPPAGPYLRLVGGPPWSAGPVFDGSGRLAGFRLPDREGVVRDAADVAALLAEVSAPD